jgi:hypothetical protein
MAIRYGTAEWDMEMERKRKERERRGFVGRTIGGNYDTAQGGASKLTRGAAKEQAGRDRMRSGGMLTSALVKARRNRRNMA